MIIPNVWENKKWQPNHQPEMDDDWGVPLFQDHFQGCPGHPPPVPGVAQLRGRLRRRALSFGHGSMVQWTGKAPRPRQWDLKVKDTLL